jgi:hypothetical protein
MHDPHWQAMAVKALAPKAGTSHAPSILPRGRAHERTAARAFPPTRPDNNSFLLCNYFATNFLACTVEKRKQGLEKNKILEKLN